MSKRILKTKLCDMLGIEYPILSAGMGPTLIGETTGAPVELVVAVSEAGGLGVLGGSGYTVDELQQAIREIKKQTDKPYGVDLLLPKYLDLKGGIGGTDAQLRLTLRALRHRHRTIRDDNELIDLADVSVDINRAGLETEVVLCRCAGLSQHDHREKQNDVRGGSFHHSSSSVAAATERSPRWFANT